MGGIEYNLRWDYLHDHAAATVKESGWTGTSSYIVTDLLEQEYSVWLFARDAFGHQSLTSEVTFTVSHLEPMVEILHPEPDSVLSGTVMISGWLQDNGPAMYSVLYRPVEVYEWEILVALSEIQLPDDIYVLWDTAGLPDGDYVVRVSYWSWASSHIYEEVNVTLANARVSVSPSDILLLEGDGSPHVMVVVHNNGGVAAEGISVEIYDDGRLLDTVGGMTIDANSFTTFTYELEGEGKHTVSVRAGSDLYDTGEIVQILYIAEEDEGAASASSPVAWVGMLAIVLSVVAIALTLAGRRGSGPAARASEEDAWVESE